MSNPEDIVREVRWEDWRVTYSSPLSKEEVDRIAAEWERRCTVPPITLSRLASWILGWK